MKRFLFVLIAIVFCLCRHALAQSQTVANGARTTTVTFPGLGCQYNWVNNTPGIGLAASGTGDIPSFIANNPGTSPITATIVATPVPSDVQCVYLPSQIDNQVYITDMLFHLPLYTGITRVGSSPYGVAVSPNGGRVYVSNKNANSVSVINAATFTVVATIPVGANPEGIVASPDGRTVYVANNGDDNITIINATTNKVTGTISVGLRPTGLVVSPDGTTLYAAMSGSANVMAINTISNRVTGAAIVGLSPLGLAINPAGTRLYVANNGANNISVVNTSNMIALPAPINVGSKPFALTVSADGTKLYASLPDANAVAVINTANNLPLTNVTVGTSPNGISFNPDGSKLYVVNNGSGYISVINTATNVVTSNVPGMAVQPFLLGNFVTGGAGCNRSPITFTITVNPTPASITATGTLAALTTGYGVPSPSTSFSLSGLSLPAGILVKPPAGFEVSTDNVNFGNSLTAGSAGNVANTTIYVRLAATAGVATYSGDISLSSGTTSATIATATSTVTAASPTIIIGSTVSGNITNCSGTASASPHIQQFTVSAVNLSAVFSATAPAGFEVSLNEGSGYGSNIDINTTGGITGNTVVYVRSSATALGPISGKVTLSSPGAISKQVQVSGYSYALPTANTVADQSVFNGASTTPIKFTGVGNNTFSWVNDNTGIGLPASGNGDIDAFTAVNKGNSSVSGVIVATPVSIPLAYVTNLISNTVSVINTATNTIAATFTVGSNPWSVAVSPDGSRAYVANYGSNDVSVINTSTNTVIATEKVGHFPKGVVISPDGTRVSVLNTGDLTISVIDAATNKVIATNPDGHYPQGTALSPDGSKAYITTEASKTYIQVMNTATNTLITDITVGLFPANITINADGSRVYVANNGSNSVSVINTATNTVIATINTGNGPLGLCLSADEKLLYVTNNNDNTVSIINTVTNSLATTITGLGEFPSAIALTQGTGCSGEPIVVNIEVKPTPPTIITSGTLDALTTQYGTASASTSFNVSGLNVHGPILVTPPLGFEVSLDDVTYTSTVNVGTTGDVPLTKVYIRLAAATPVNTYSGDIVLSSVDAASVKVPTVTSTVTETIPTIITGTISGVISACLGTPSASPNIQRVTVLGSLLTDNIIVTADAGFEVSLTVSGGFSKSLLLSPVGGKVPLTMLYVRSSASAALGSISGNIILTATGAITRRLPVSGSINALPVANSIAPQRLPGGAATKPIAFTGSGNTYVWANDKPGIGLAASGSDDIAAFTAVNNTGSSIVANLTAIPISAAFAYVASQTSNSVAIINTGSNKIIKSIPVGSSPYATAVSPDGSRVYVTNQSSGTVSVITTATNSIINTIPAGTNPSGIVVNLDGTRLYVTNSNNQIVSVVNLATNSILTTIPVGKNPDGIALSADGSKVYVVNRNSTNVSVISTQTNSVVNTINVGTSPEGIAVSRDGNTIYVSNYNARSVSVINAATYAVTTVAVGINPRGMAVSADGGLLYVANNGSANVSVINTVTNQVTATIAVGQFPQGLCASPDGTKVLVANYGSKSVTVINTGTNAVTGTVTMPGAPVSLGNFITGGTGCSGNPINFTITVDPASAYITATGDLTALKTIYGTPSASANFSVSGVAMPAPILVSPPTGYEVSTDNVNFKSSLTIGAPGLIAATTVYIRLTGITDAGTYGGNVVLSSAGAGDVKVPTVLSEVGPTLLTIIADNKTRVEGKNNPALTASYNGFVNNNTPAQLSTLPQVSTTADLTSPVGTYPITASGAAAANYTFAYVDGLLTVIQSAQSLQVPNAFTPNGDGTNDTWVIKNLNTYADVVVKIYNRNGQNIFLSNNYATAWDGRYKGANLPTGTYYYVINVSGSKPITGYVAIIR